MLYLFTTPSCPNCPQAKRLLESHSYRFESIDASKPTGLAMARQFEIAQVPSLLVTDAEGHMKAMYRGIEEIAHHIKGL